MKAWITLILILIYPAAFAAGRALPDRNEDLNETATERLRGLRSFEGNFRLAALEQSRLHDREVRCPEHLEVEVQMPEDHSYHGVLRFKGLTFTRESTLPQALGGGKTQDLIFPVAKEHEVRGPDPVTYWRRRGKISRYHTDRERGIWDQVVTHITLDSAGFTFQINRRGRCSRWNIFCLPEDQRFFGDTVQCGYLRNRS
jgi:hypothetical protein